MGSLVLYILLLYSSLLWFQRFPTLKLVKGDATLVQETCKNTRYYELCVSWLRSDPSSLKADTKGLAVIMVGIGLGYATDTSTYLSNELKGSSVNDSASNSKKVLKLCSDKYAYSCDALQSALRDLGLNSFDYASVYVTAASDYYNACHNAFRSVRSPPLPDLAYPPELARREQALKHLCDIALAIIDLLVGQD